MLINSFWRPLNYSAWAKVLVITHFYTKNRDFEGLLTGSLSLPWASNIPKTIPIVMYTCRNYSSTIGRVSSQFFIVLQPIKDWYFVVRVAEATSLANW